MKIRTQLPSKQKGFSILTGIILTIIMFGSLAFFLAGQGVNASFGSTYTNTSKAASLLASAGYIKTGFDSVLLNGTIPSAIRFDDTATTGIFNPSSGGAVEQNLDPSIFVAATSNPYWIYRSNMISLEDVGGTANSTGDYSVIAPGLKQAICQQINNMLFGTPVTTAPPLLTVTLAQLVTGDALGGTAPTLSRFATVSSGTTDLSASAELVNGKLSGCYTTASPTNYVYIHTLLAQ
jgi:hypothetical protein